MFQVFVGDGINGVGLGYFGQGHRPQGPNHQMEFFD